jgi:hypothetical protein
MSSSNSSSSGSNGSNGGGSSNSNSKSSSTSHVAYDGNEESNVVEPAGLNQSNSRSRLLLKAYKEKMTILENVREQRNKNAKKIKSNTPVRAIDRKKIHKVENHWWEKAPCLAGEAMNSSQAKLSNVENFSQIVRDRVLDKVHDSNNYGEYCHDPLKARKLLMNLSYRDLTIPGRAADFRTGVEWRLMLRPSLSK